jgi:tetratricopeptide (TPR) repeat protein
MTSNSTVALRRRPILQWLTVAVMFFASMNAAAADSKSERAAAHIASARDALSQHQYRTAASEYRKAAELSKDVEVAQQATHIGYSYGFDADALASAKRWAKLDKESDEALLYVAQLELRTGDVRRSGRSFKKLLERGVEPVDERLATLTPILSQEDPQDAYEVMNKLASPYKDSSDAHYAVAVMALQAGDAVAAQSRAQRAMDLDPDWLKPKLLYARAMLLAGDVEGAIDYTARIIGDDPDPDPEARLELAIMLLAADRDDDALSQVNQILLEQPNRTDALRLMAIINFRLEHLDAAWDDFQDLLASGRYTMDALYYLARIADRRSEHERAIRLYSQVTRGSNAVLSQRRASGIMSQQGETEAALSHLKTFGRENPMYAVDMLQAQAQLLASLERYPEALENYDRVVEYRPDSEPAHLGKAELLLRMGRQDDAIEQYRATVKRWPKSATSLNALGYTLADRTENYTEAAKLIDKALAMEPDNAAIIDSYGWVLYRQGEYEKALQQLDRAYELLKDPEVAAHIVEVLWKLERTSEAKKALEDAELTFPDAGVLLSIRERAFPDDS